MLIICGLSVLESFFTYILTCLYTYIFVDLTVDPYKTSCVSTLFVLLLECGLNIKYLFCSFSDSQIKYDKFLAPYACAEIGFLYKANGRYDEAVSQLEEARYV